MGDYRPNNRGGFGGNRGGSSGGFGGNRGGGRSFGGNRGGFGGGNRGSFGGREDRGPVTMHDAVCSKCSKACQVPFKPTGSKPVFCSDCFRQMDGGNSAPRGHGNSSGNQSFASSGGMTSDQFKQIDRKLDKILQVLQDLEIDVVEEGDEDSEDEKDDDSEED